MSRRPAKNLTDEDRVLWSLVARSATPLRGKRSVEVPDVVLEPEKTPPKSEPVPQPASKRSEKAGDGHAIHALDRPTHDKLARGRMPIEGRVDLHGLTQDEIAKLLRTSKTAVNHNYRAFAAMSLILEVSRPAT